MFSFLAVLVSVVLIYIVQRYSPFMAGVIAVVPIKIISAVVFSYSEGGVKSINDTISGALIGQF